MEDCEKTFKGNSIVIQKNYLLNEMESIVVTSYTYEDEKNEASPYRIINNKLWYNNTEDQLKEKKSYLRLLLGALRKLPRTELQTLFRGIKKDKHKYTVGEEVTWKGFTSTSTSMKVTQAFLTDSRIRKVEGTLFEIRNEWGYSVADFSEFPDESGTQL